MVDSSTIYESQKGATFWFTGLSGAGKSTLSEALKARLDTELGEKKIFILDGDVIRTGLNKGLGFSEADRAENIRRISEVSKLFNMAGQIVFVAFISPYKAARDMAKKLHADAGLEFCETHISASLEVCEGRDVKGLYAKARAGEIKNFTGISDPFEAPENPDLNVNTGALSPEVCQQKVIEYMLEKKIIAKKGEVESESTDKFHAQRTICPNLTFMHADDLEKMIADRTFAIKKYCELMGPQHGTLLVDGDKAVGIQTLQGEKLMLVDGVALGEVPDTFNRIREATKAAVRREIKKAVDFQGDVIGLVNSDCIGQAIHVADNIRNTAAMEEMIRNVMSCKDGRDSELKIMNDHQVSIEAKLDALSAEIKKDNSDSKKATLHNVLVQNVANFNYLRHVLLPLLHHNDKHYQMSRFLLTVRHYWDNGVKVKCSAFEMNYGYEYLGNANYLIQTDLTREAYVHHARAMNHGKGFFGTGPAGTGKTETAKDFYSLCGRLTIVINCSDQLTAEDCQQIFRAGRKGDTCLCFDEYNRLTKEVSDKVLGHLKREFLGYQRGVTFTMNPGYAGRTPISEEYYKVCDVLAYTVPAFETLCQHQLWSQGMGRRSEDLYKPMTQVWLGWRHHMSKQDWYDFGLRPRLAAVRQAGAMHRSGVDQAVAIKTALNDHLAASYEAADKDTYKKVLDEHFPDIEIADQSDEISKKIQEANADQDDYTKLKMDQLYRKTRVRHSCILLSNETKIVEGVLKGMGGTFSLLKAETEHDQLIDVELRAALLKAHEVENHWVVLQGPANYQWCLCLEDFNQLCDDNKKLCCKDNTVITLAPTSRIIIVSPDCKQMSPATVSRNGIVNALYQ